MRSYEAARSLFSFLGFVAWSVVVIGVLVALISAGGVGRYAGGGAGLLAMVPGVSIGIAGFILVAFVQMGRATVDTAEYTQQMLKIARDQLDVSKQGLNQGKALEQGFAALKQAPDEMPVASFDTIKEQLALKRPPFGLQAGSNSREIVQLSDDGSLLEYRGYQIEVTDGKFSMDGVGYATLFKAQKRIDQIVNSKI